MAYDGHFYISPQDKEVFSVAACNDVIIRTEQPTQQILISPAPISSESNCMLVVSSSGLRVSGNILPSKSNTYNIGSSASRFKTAYLSDVQFVGSSNQVVLNVNPSGDLQMVKYTGFTSNVVNLSRGGGSDFWSACNNKVYVIGSNVGMGTSNPTEQLHVVGNTRIDGNLLFSNTIALTGITLSPNSNNNPINNVTSVISAINGFSNVNNGQGILLYTASNTSSNYFKFMAGPDQVFKVDGQGNLEVAGDALVDGSIGSRGLTLFPGGSPSFLLATSDGNGLSNEPYGLNVHIASNTASNYIRFTACNVELVKITASNGDLFVKGSINAQGSKAFDMPHPDPRKLEKGFRLRHTSIEAPTRGDTIYTFKIATKQLDEIFEIPLPSYWSHLNEAPRVFISYEGSSDLDLDYSMCCAKVHEERIVGKCQKPGIYNIMVMGTRKDMYAYASFDDVGGVEYIRTSEEA